MLYNADEKFLIQGFWMCGIFGWIDEQTPLKCANEVIATMRHRGPDDDGWVALKDSNWLSDVDTTDLNQGCDAVLGHLRLAIIDLSSDGHQPMQSQNGRYQMVYNGEIYNYIELRTELMAMGHKFKTHTDSEVLLVAWEAWGQDMLNRLVGMFTFAIIDKETRTLTLARDPFGIKPLYYANIDGCFYFASELPSLLKFKKIPRKINWQKAADYMLQGAPDLGEQSMLQDIYYLEAAHCLTLPISQPDSMTTHKYWSPNPNVDLTITKQEAIDKLSQLFKESMDLHLRSDVPVGVALSGGLDSTLTTCFIRNMHPNLEMHAFSFIAKDSPANEEKWIDAVVEHTNVISHKIIIEPNEIIADMDDFILSQGEPCGGQTVYAQYRIFKEAKKQGITVLLEGQGADESWAGYWGYPEYRLLSLLKQGKLISAFKFLQASGQYAGRSSKDVVLRLMQYFLSKTPPSIWRMGRQWMKKSVTPKFINHEALKTLDIKIEWLYPQQFQGKNALKNRMASELPSQKLIWLLRYSDRASMRSSIESRVPFLTTSLVEYALSLPEAYLVENAEPKHMLKALGQGVIPQIVMDRKDKNGFHTPPQWNTELNIWYEKMFEDIKEIPFIDENAFHKTKNQLTTDMKWRIASFLRWKNLIQATGS